MKRSRISRMKKAQASTEFIILVSFTIMVLAVFVVIMQNNLTESEKNRREIRAEQIANIVVSEISLAQQSPGDYQRTFFLPISIQGENYTIELRNTGQDVYVKYRDVEHVSFLNVQVGNPLALSPGYNTIQKACTTLACSIKLQ